MSGLIAQIKAKLSRSKGGTRKELISNEIGDIREFVYLDETSVYSLYASLHGARPETITDTLSQTMKGEASAEVTGDAVIAKGKAASKFERSRTSDSQVLRKVGVQAAFKLLKRSIDSRLRLKPAESDSSVSEAVHVALESISSVDSGSPTLGSDVRHIRRGDLVEIDVALSPDSIFRFSSALDAISNIVAENAELMGESKDSAGMRQTLALNDVLNQLMVGLVPLMCKATDLEVAMKQGGEYILSTKYIDAHANEFDSRLPLHVAGVADQDLFWKDIRRLLFTSSRFRVLGRLAKSGLVDSWSPVKMVDVLNDIAPDLATGISWLGPAAIEALRHREQVSSAAEISVDSSLHVDYAEKLAALNDYTLNQSDVEAVRDLARSETFYDQTSVESRFKTLKPIHSYVESVSGQVDDDQASAIRWALLEQESAVAASPRSPSAPLVQAPTSQRILEIEIVAIYW